MTLPSWLTKFWKLIPAIAGAVGQVIALGVLTGSALHYAQIILAVLTVVGVWAVPKNTP